MSNKSSLYLEDELKDESNSSTDPYSDLLGNADTPYQSVSDRPALPDEETEVDGAEEVPSNPVRDTIMKRQQSSYHPTPFRQTLPRGFTVDEFKNDPLMGEYEETQKDLEKYRRAKLEADSISNMGQAFSQFAQGVEKPVQNKDLYRNIERQNADMLKSKSQDIERRTGVIEAIERRKTRERTAQEYANARRDVASMNQQNKYSQQNTAADFRTDKLLSGLGSKFEQDPILKPAQVNLASLQKARSILGNTSAPLTTQSLSDAETDLASALNLRPTVLSEGKIKRTEIDDLNRSIGALKQKWGNSMVDMRTEAPEIVEQLTKLNDILSNDYVETINKRQQELIDKQKALVDNDRVKAGLDRFSSVSKVKGVETKPQKSILKKQFSASRNKTKIIYSDGTEEILDGKQ